VSFDPSDPAFIADPYPTLNTLRESAAVHYDERLDRWLVTRHADVRACLRDKRLGRNFRHVGTEAEFKANHSTRSGRRFGMSSAGAFSSSSRRSTPRIRKLVAAAFTPRAVEALREPAETLARELIDACLARDRFDLLYDFAQPYSITLICHLLGVPTDRQRDLLDWSHRHVKMYEFDTTNEQAVSATNAAAEFRDYVLELIGERRREPRDDMVTALVEARVDGAQTERRRDHLNRRRAAERRTRSDCEHTRKRHACPPSTSGRVAATRLRRSVAGNGDRRVDSLGSAAAAFRAVGARRRRRGCGVPISRGEVILMLFGSANRDPRVFSEPDRLDVARANAGEHIGFGGGIHVCIGAPLARIELEVSLRTLVERAPSLELAAEPTRVSAFVIRGFEAVDVVTNK